MSEGRLKEAIDVVVNRAVVEHDVCLVLGPVFPHEVVGFSGGNKYFVPGVAGQEIIDFSHWLGALITSSEIIGPRGTTPVRALIDDAVHLNAVPGALGGDHRGPDVLARRAAVGVEGAITSDLRDGEAIAFRNSRDAHVVHRRALDQRADH